MNSSPQEGYYIPIPTDDRPKVEPESNSENNYDDDLRALDPNGKEVSSESRRIENTDGVPVGNPSVRRLSAGANASAEVIVDPSQFEVHH